MGSASPRTSNFQLLASILGVGPKDRTGKSLVSYCPGGNRSFFSRFGIKPWLMMAMFSQYTLSFYLFDVSKKNLTARTEYSKKDILFFHRKRGDMRRIKTCPRCHNARVIFKGIFPSPAEYTEIRQITCPKCDGRGYIYWFKFKSRKYRKEKVPQ